MILADEVCAVPLIVLKMTLPVIVPCITMPAERVESGNRHFSDVSGPEEGSHRDNSEGGGRLRATVVAAVTVGTRYCVAGGQRCNRSAATLRTSASLRTVDN